MNNPPVTLECQGLRLKVQRQNEELADAAVVLKNRVDTMSAIARAATGLEDLDACKAEFDRVGNFPSDYIRHLRERAEAAEAVVAAASAWNDTRRSTDGHLARLTGLSDAVNQYETAKQKGGA